MDEEANATLAAASAAEQAALLESKQAEVLNLQRALSEEIKKQEEEVPNATHVLNCISTRSKHQCKTNLMTFIFQKCLEL